MAISRIGHVIENPASGDHVIGIRWFDDTGGDGSVTVTPTSEYLLQSEQAGWNNLMVGGYFGTGLLSVSGSGAVATLAAPSSPTGETRATIGADANFPGGGSGRVEALNGGVFRLLGTGASGTGRLEVAPVFGNATVLADGGTISVSGFSEAFVDIGTTSGTGTFTVQNGGRLSLAGNGSAALNIGPDGTGTLAVLAGGTIDLGGSGQLQVGGPGIVGEFTQGILEVHGEGAQVIGLGQAWIGVDPTTTTETPRSRGTLDLDGGGSIGNAGAQISVGVMGEISAGTGTVTGQVNLANGSVNMMDDARGLLTFNGDLAATAGVNWIMLEGGAPEGTSAGDDLIRVSGEFRLDGADSLIIELLGQAGYRFVTGDHLVLMEASNFDFGTAGTGVTAHVHAAFNHDFGYVFGVVPASGAGQPERLEFEALSNMDGPGSAILDLAGGTLGATVTAQTVALGELTTFFINGGRFEWAAATSLDGLVGTAQADSFLLAGLSQALALDGGNGNDRLVSGAGNDTLRGGDGVDTLNGGSGDDFLFGGSTGADLRDVIFGGDGNDSIDAGSGNDETHGGNGNDTVIGGFGSDTLIGNDGADVIVGSGGSDVVFGNAGRDFINGGFGHDRLNGGSEADNFFHQGVPDHGSDWIQDYNAAEGDVLTVGLAGATRAQFQINTTTTANAGAADVAESFIIYRPTGQILWALVDGDAQSQINVQIGGQVFDLMA